MKKIILFSICSLFLTIAQANNEKGLPDITLEDVNGKKVNILELSKSGKTIVMGFWATWCSPCKKEMSNMAELVEEWKTKYNVEVIAISIDDARNKAKVKSYTDGEQWPFPILLDVNQDLKRALNFQTIPYTVVIDKNGKIAETHSGYVEGDEFILQEKLEKLK